MEIKQYRSELIEVLDRAWCDPVAFNDSSGADTIVGQYIEINDDGIGAELLVSLLLDGRLHIHGIAVRGPNFHSGSFEPVEHWPTYHLRIDFSAANQLAMVSDSYSPTFGASVQFDGTYV